MIEPAATATGRSWDAATPPLTWRANRLQSSTARGLPASAGVHFKAPSTLVATAPVATAAPAWAAHSPACCPAHKWQRCLDGELPVDVPLLILVHANRRVSARAVHALDAANDLLATKGRPGSAATATPGLGCGRAATADGTASGAAWPLGGTDPRSCRLPGGKQAKILTGNGVLPLFAEELALIEQIDVRREEVVVLAGIQHDGPGILLAPEDQFLFVLTNLLLSPGGQHRSHADGHDRHHNQQHDHREAAIVQSEVWATGQASRAHAALTL